MVSKYLTGSFADELPPDHPTESVPVVASSPFQAPYIAIGVFAAVCVFALMYTLAIRPGSRSGPSPTDSIGASSPPSIPPGGTVFPPSTPAATLPVATWHKVVKFKGAGTHGTASFSIRGNQWRVTWATRPPATGRPAFKVDAKTDNGRFQTTIANPTGAAQDSVVYKGAGDYSLTINASQPYLVFVEDYY